MNKYSINIEVLEPLLLMSASGVDVDLSDSAAEGSEFAEAASIGTLFADAGEEIQGSPGDINFLIGDAGETPLADGNEAVVYVGKRADYVVEHQGFGIFSVTSDAGTDLLTDIQSLSFDDGPFSLIELAGITPAESELPAELTADIDEADIAAQSDLTIAPESIPEVSQSIFTYDIETPPGSEQGGDIQSVSTSFNETTNEFSFRMVVADADGDDQTNGFTLAVNDGPNPKGNGDEMALFYFDGSGSDPVVSAYNYNGQDDFTSYQDAPLVTSAGDNSPFTSIEVSVDDDGNRVYSFTMDATSIVDHSDGADWTGVSFSDSLGMWLHPMTNLSTAYGSDGFLESWSFDDHGWFDAKDQATNQLIVDIAPPPLPPLPPPPVPVDPDCPETTDPILIDDTGLLPQQPLEPNGTEAVDVIPPILIDDSGLLPATGSVDIPAFAFADVTFVSESTSVQSTVGTYSIDPATGEISDVRILFGNASMQNSGGTLLGGETDSKYYESQQSIGFFILANGNGLNNLSDFDASSLTLVGTEDGGIGLVSESVNGEPVAFNGRVYVSDSDLNPDGAEHFRITPTDNGFSIRVEDTGGLGDQDYNDVVLNLTIAQTGGPDPLPDDNGDDGTTPVDVIVTDYVPVAPDNGDDGTTPVDVIVTDYVPVDPDSGDDGTTPVDVIVTDYVPVDPGNDTIIPTEADWFDGENETVVIDTTEDCDDAPVTPVNNAPDAQDDVETVESVALNASVAGNDSDADGDDLTFYVAEGPANGSLSFNEDGSYTYTPDPGFCGQDSFTYEATDGNGGSSIATVTINVAPTVNQAPDAVDDSNATVANESVSGSVAGNDSDADGDNLTFYINEGPTNGSIEFSEDGSYTYTPDPGYSGTDTFTYEAFDGIDGSTIATVTIAVAPAPNQAPDAVDDYNTTDYNTAINGRVLCNDVDPDADSLTVVTNTPPANGTVTVSTNGEYTYTPNDGFSGEDTFTYTITDCNGGTDTATVTICVGPPPVVNGNPDAIDDVNSTDYQTAVDGNVLPNDTDPDGDSLFVSLTQGTSNGSITLYSNGDYSYTPNDGFTGQDTFTYQVDDGNGGTDTATVTIDVGPAPVINGNPDAIDDTNSTAYQTVVDGNVLPNDTDPDGDSLTVSLLQGTGNGSVTLNSDGSYSYTPNDGFTGQDTFTYQVDDGNGGTDTATVTIDVGPAPVINGNPDAVDDVDATDYQTAVDGNVLPNDSDPDGDSLMVSLTQGTSNGSITLYSNGDYSYTPNDGFTGQDTFTYQVSDGNGGTDTAVVTIDVGPAPVVNGDPNANDDTDSTAYQTAVDGNVLPNDSDPDGDSLTVSLTQGPGNGSVTVYSNGDYAYTPNDGFTGQDTFSYQVDDGNGGTDTAIVTIDVGPAPVVGGESTERNTIAATDDNYATSQDTSISGNVLDNDLDPDGDTLSTTVLTDVRTSEGGTVSLLSDGSFNYTPATGFTGTDTFVYESSDGNGNVTTANVTITVSDATLLAVDDGFAANYNDTITGTVVSNDVGVDGDVQVNLITGPANGTLTLNSDGTFTYQPNDGYSGEDTFRYTLVDGASTSQANVRLIIGEVQYDTTYVGGERDGYIWGDPHFRGDDGGLFDVQGKVNHTYSLLSDTNLQLNAKFIHWQGVERDGTVIGEIGLVMGSDKLYMGLDGGTLNGIDIAIGQSTIGNGTIDYDGTAATINTGEYILTFTREDGLFSVRLNVIDPFSDLVAPHGLWGQTVDGDQDVRDGDFYKDNFDYGLQGGGAIDKLDANGDIVRSERGDQTSFSLYETLGLFSTSALRAEGDAFFRFDAERGTGLAAL